MTGIQQTTLAARLRGKYPLDVDQVEKIARALGFDTHVLLLLPANQIIDERSVS